MSVIRHRDQSETNGYRPIIGKAAGAHATTLWDQSLPPGAATITHYHECKETHTFLSGSAEVTIHGETFLVEADSSVLIPARAIHQIRNTTPGYVRLLAFFSTNEPEVIASDMPIVS